MREEETVCVSSDGSRYWKVCGEAIEAFFPEGGFMGMKKHSRQCACDRKAYDGFTTARRTPTPSWTWTLWAGARCC